MTSIKTENGYRAWQKLHMRFGPSLSCKQGMVLMEFSAMVAKPAKTPDETRNLITEMERKIKLVEDVTAGRFRPEEAGVTRPFASHQGRKRQAAEMDTPRSYAEVASTTKSERQPSPSHEPPPRARPAV